jgi:ribosomal protein S18 acetylase RimI-like enzyme
LDLVELDIRPISDGDVLQTVELWTASGVSRPWNDAFADIAFARQSPHCTLLIGVVGGRVVATTMVGEDGHRGWVYYVAIDPQVQRGGVGRNMMEAAEAWLKVRGIWKMQLLIREDNADARGFYERLGYKDTKTVCLQKIISDQPRM